MKRIEHISKARLPEEVSELLEAAKDNGYLTHQEIQGAFADLTQEEGNLFYQVIAEWDLDIVDSTVCPMIDNEPPSKSFVPLDKAGPQAFNGRVDDPVQMYLNSLNFTPKVLTKEEEREIGMQMERGSKTVIKALSRLRVLVPEIMSISQRTEGSMNHKSNAQKDVARKSRAIQTLLKELTQSEQLVREGERNLDALTDTGLDKKLVSKVLKQQFRSSRFIRKVLSNVENHEWFIGQADRYVEAFRKAEKELQRSEEKIVKTLV